MKKATSLLLCLLLLSLSLPAVATDASAGVSISAPSAVLMHSSGKVLYEKEAHKELEPASVTKVMTLLLIFEAIEADTLGLGDIVTVSANAAGMGGSQVYLKEGEQFTVDEMLKCIVISSANDCSVVMAEHLAGSEEAFVQRMNSRAAQLGMEHTNFVNCCGLPAQGHYSSAYDIALMSAQLMRHTKITDYTLVWQDSIRDGAFTLTNTNRLVRSFDGITGLKTGSTSTAGFCMSATASRDGLDLIAVVMKADTRDTRNDEAARLLSYGFANYACVSLTPDRPIMPVEVALGKEPVVKCDLADSSPRVYDKAKLARVEKEIIMDGPITAPVAQGTQVGQMIVRADDEIIARVPIVTQSAVQRKGVWDIFLDILRMMTMCKK